MFSKNIVLVSMPEWRGAGRHGTELAPKAFEKFGIGEKLQVKGIKIASWYQGHLHTKKEYTEAKDIKYETEIVDTLQRSFLLLRCLVEEENVLVVLGGDHTISIASVAAQTARIGDASKVGLIWIDAHYDAHTPESSPSGNIHGMPLAVLLGYGSKRLTSIGGEFPKVCPQNVIHIGGNSFEMEEDGFFTKLGIQRFSQSEVVTSEGFERACKAITDLDDGRVETIVVSVDADAFHKTVAPGVHLRNKNGIPEETGYAFARHISTCTHIGGIDLAEIVPRNDRGHKTIQFMYRFLEKLLAP